MKINEKLLKPYDPKETEQKIYRLWEESGFFNPDNLPGERKETFTVMMPPPNATGVLHMGHALFLTLEDIMVRYKRMQGFKTLWLPGTDHASIATQSKVEGEIKKKEWKSRHDLGREELLKRIDAFVESNRNTMTTQMRVMGASCDWSREAFTLDEKRNLAVNTMFKKMYEDGLIYRGNRIVNWDPKGQTTISDDEIVYEERTAKMYTFKYSKDFPISISTTRPETKVGDVAVAVHPEDTRYKEFVGKVYDLEFCGVPIHIKIIADKEVDPAFGTGALGVTPAHSMTDWEIADRHDLPRPQVINEYAKMSVGGENLLGKKTTEAREVIVEWLKSENLLEKEEEIKQNVSTAERTGGIIEPLPKLQWFVNVNKPIKDRGNKTLKDLMREPFEKEEIKIIPDYFSKTYFHWIENLRDWCISRQIWYGHRVPVWYDKEGKTFLPNFKTLLFARHGQSETNINKVLETNESTTLSPLTEKGRLDALELGKYLKNKKIDKIISSDMKRAKETAEIINQELGINYKIEMWPELHEIYFGDENAGKIKPVGYNPLSYAVSENTGESLTEIENRAKKVIEKIKNLKEENILIVAHGTFNAVIQATLDCLEKERFVEYREKLKIKNGSVTERIICTEPEGENLTQDEDTLDTWFSAGTWTFSTLGWPEKTKDLEMYHPSDVLETGYEILFFWVARMVLMSKYALGEIPFKKVYLHGTVRDAKGRKMSKSLGNGIDPLDIAQKYGADAGRMALVVGTAPGTDSKVDENKIKGYKNFSNKIWNITRFVLDNTNENNSGENIQNELTEEFKKIAEDITSDMENYRFHLAAEKIYHYIWHRFADEIIEESKKNENLKSALLPIWKDCLKILHPFMPFVTEEIWSILESKSLLMVEKWPT